MQAIKNNILLMYERLDKSHGLMFTVRNNLKV